ncbi:MAG: cytochrome C oxidase subunit IV family protein [Vicinamibacterales bacterium]
MSDHGQEGAHGHISPLSLYIGIFLALMVLTGITVYASFVNLGSFNAPVALAIAILKATLVILYFMHVKYSSKLTKLVVMTGLFFLAILLTETMMDYATRGFPGKPPHLMQ